MYTYTQVPLWGLLIYHGWLRVKRQALRLVDLYHWLHRFSRSQSLDDLSTTVGAYDLSIYLSVCPFVGLSMHASMQDARTYSRTQQVVGINVLTMTLPHTADSAVGRLWDSPREHARFHGALDYMNVAGLCVSTRPSVSVLCVCVCAIIYM